MPDAARELAEAGAAYAGQPDGPRPPDAGRIQPSTATPRRGVEPEVAEAGGDAEEQDEVARRARS